MKKEGEVYTLDEAIRVLVTEEPLIDKIKKTERGLKVLTKEITPARSSYLKSPYSITVSKDRLNRLRIYILRTKSKRDGEKHHEHIFEYGSVCWGNIEDLIKDLKKKQDWYWLVKLSLELIQNKDDKHL